MNEKTTTPPPNPAAFPRPGFDDRDCVADQEGMSLRDYFAAHPPPIPDWFTSEGQPMPADIPLPWGRSALTTICEYRGILASDVRDRSILLDEAWRCWGDGIDDDQLDADVLAKFKAHREAIAAAGKERLRIKHLNEALRHAAWAYTYADAMLQTR